MISDIYIKKKSNIKSTMINMKSKNTIKLDNVGLDKTYPEENMVPEDGLWRYLYQPGEQNWGQIGRFADLQAIPSHKRSR